VTGLLSYFQGRLFSSSDVQRGKPSPDLFLYAADQMGADPSSCAVVEDSRHGVMAGLAAGMSVFGYSPEIDLDDIPGIAVFRRMSDLIGLLDSRSGLS
jgi:beta-phosphoglucomutase-like phosphatase (HAD superfamily)